MNVTSCRMSPYVESKQHATGLLLANHTNVSAVFRQILRQYRQMRDRKAMLHQYEKEGTDTTKTMDMSYDRIVQTIELYEETTKFGFPAGDEEREESRRGCDTVKLSPM